MSKYVIEIHDDPDADPESGFDVRYALAHSPLFHDVPWTVEPLNPLGALIQDRAQLQARCDRLVEQVANLRRELGTTYQRKDELTERLRQIQRLAAGQVPTESTPTGDPDHDRLAAYTANQVTARQG